MAAMARPAPAASRLPAGDVNVMRGFLICSAWLIFLVVITTLRRRCPVCGWKSGAAI
jgi:hypothetical protein